MSPVERGRRTKRAGVALVLLQAFELRFDGRVVPLPPSAQRLLALLALHERPLLRPYVAATLWLDSPEDRAAANLRSSLWRINRTGCKLVDATNLQLALSSDVLVDVREAMELAHRILTSSGTGSRHEINLARTRLTGELLPDWYDDWVILERERLRQLSVHALEALSERLLEAQRLGEALEIALTAVGSEPLRESAHRLLIRIHLEEGNSAEAIRQFEVCRRLFRDRLGMSPSLQLAELVSESTSNREHAPPM